MNPLLESTIKVSLIVLVALAAMVLLRRRSAAMRHWLLSAAIACAAAAPMLEPFAPEWTVQLNVPASLGNQPQQASVSGSESAPEQLSPTVRAAETRSSLSWDPALTRFVAALPWDSTLAGIWLLGSAISLLLLAVGLGRLAWLASRAERLVDGRWAELADDIAREFALKRPVTLLQSHHPTLLVTWGFRRPKVILPASAREWSDDRMRVVLLHELAHIRRGDWLTQMAAESLRAAYWFNPLIWLASRRLRQESEHACDDAVLSGGIDGAEYATHLLALARSIREERRSTFHGFPAPAMARPSSLERRFSAMLNGHLNRSPITRPMRAATTTAVVIVTVLIAGFGAAQTFSTFSGSVLDPTNRILPGVTLVLTNAQSQAKYEIRTDSTGRFEFVGLPPGEYAWESSLPGFANLKGTVMVAGRNVQQNLALEVGSLEETISIVAKAGAAASAAEASPPRRSGVNVEEFRRQQRAKTVCDGAPTGGNIKAPVKLADARPRYPTQLSAAGIGGVVVLDARIGTDGDVIEASVARSAHPDLDSAAVDAVRLWQFSSTLLNCQPIEVKMKVTALFKTEQ